MPLAGLPLGVATLSIFALWPDGFSVAGVAALLFVGGIGMGTMYPTTTVLIQNAVPPHQLGTATGTLNFFRQLGGAIVVAVFGAIVLGGFDVHTTGIVLERLSDVGGSAADFAALFRWVFIAAAGFLGVQYNPFVVQNVKQPLSNTDYAAGVNMVRFLKRKQALESLEDDFAARTGDPKIKGRRAVYARAIRNHAMGSSNFGRPRKASAAAAVGGRAARG